MIEIPYKTVYPILDHYGSQNQKRKAKEELLELCEAIDHDKVAEVMDEMADVIIMLGQIKQIYDIGTRDLTTTINYKIARQTMRMRDEVQDAEER